MAATVQNQLTLSCLTCAGEANTTVPLVRPWAEVTTTALGAGLERAAVVVLLARETGALLVTTVAPSSISTSIYAMQAGSALASHDNTAHATRQPQRAHTTNHPPANRSHDRAPLRMPAEPSRVAAAAGQCSKLCKETRHT